MFMSYKGKEMEDIKGKEREKEGKGLEDFS